MFVRFAMLQFLFFHHLLAVFLYFGWLSPSPVFLGLYILLVLLVVFHWMTNHQKCYLTQIINRYCGYDDGEGFHDLFYIFKMKQQNWFDRFIYSYLLFTFILSLLKIVFIERVSKIK
jgi:hypothetical protein